MTSTVGTEREDEAQGAANLLGITRDGLRRATGSSRHEVHGEMAIGLSMSIPNSAWRRMDQFEASSVAAVAMLEEIGPRDLKEGMLAAQMVTLHNMAMECFHRAMLQDQSSQITDMYLRHAGRLTSLYERHLACLDRRRGQGQQTIRVEHVGGATERAKKKITAARGRPESPPINEGAADASSEAGVRARLDAPCEVVANPDLTTELQAFATVAAA